MRRYLRPDEKAPAWADIKTGRSGGRYYECKFTYKDGERTRKTGPAPPEPPSPEPPKELKLVPAGAKVTKLDVKSDEYIAWLMGYHPPIEIHWCDDTVSTVPFADLDATLQHHNETVHGRRPHREEKHDGKGR